MKIQLFSSAFMVLLTSLLFTGCNEKTTPSPYEIEVEGGIIKGIPASTSGIALFAGVPYAAPPTGDLRWREPQPVIPWEGVRMADKFSAVCYQFPMPAGSFYEKEFYPDGLPELSEDCLYLNVWAPLEKKTLKPVVMWIHGGAFDHGWGHEMEFDGNALAGKDVILVTINYRVGVFGFMAHPLLTQESPNCSSGNYGILDQIAALKWIKDNIKQFGGNPDNITVMGQSAGARSVMALLSSPLTKGMISKAIIQSGGGYRRGGAMASLNEQEQACTEFATFMNAATLQDMKAISPDNLLDLHKEYNQVRQENNERGVRFSPNVDGYTFEADIDATLDNGKQHLVPAIIGYNAQDGSPENLKRAAEQWSEMREKQNGAETYIYSFDRQLPGDEAGAFHSAELWYTFGTLDRCWRPFTEADHNLSEQMIGYWSNFMHTGSPNDSNLSPWPAAKESNSYIKTFDVE